MDVVDEEGKGEDNKHIQQSTQHDDKDEDSKDVVDSVDKHKDKDEDENEHTQQSTEHEDEDEDDRHVLDVVDEDEVD